MKISLNFLASFYLLLLIGLSACEKIALKDTGIDNSEKSFLRTPDIAILPAFDPDGIGFNFAVPNILNPWTNSNRYINLANKVSPGILRFPGGTVANYWDCEHNIFSQM